MLASAKTGELPGTLASIGEFETIRELTCDETRFAKLLPHLEFS
jgi:hypothetical protein